VSATLLAELGYTLEEEERPLRSRTPDRDPAGELTPPPSPVYSAAAAYGCVVKVAHRDPPPESPDYYPSDASGRYRSRSNSPRRQLEEAQGELLTAHAKTAQASLNFKQIRERACYLKSRVIYLEGELAAYKRLVTDHCNPRKPQFSFYPPPPPPPRFLQPPPPPPRVYNHRPRCA
jgi:hypothetical protein